MTARKEVRDVADELRRVAVAAGDGGGHFAAMYGGMTDRVAARIDAGAFDDGRRLLVVQHLLLGIEAHVNFDLPQVLVSVADREGDLAAARQTSMRSTTCSRRGSGWWCLRSAGWPGG